MVNLVEEFSQELSVVKSFTHTVDVRTLTIPLCDGVELAARLWLPSDALRSPVPAIVEYIPYRQRDYTALRDGLIHPWFAGHGFAALRVDMRGSGDSGGVPMDEYVEQEQQDALEVLAYLAAQPWCNGATGMMGISWGGFNALQVAACRPASLKAIITVCSTDDRYTDDVHYPGGCLVSDNLTWGTLGFANMGRPPDPEVVGSRWREMWLHRLENSPFPLAEWLSHQRRDAYWKHGSVAENYQAIDCPVFAIGGWADSYTNAIPRLMQGLRVPRRALIGPWVHAYPHLATPGPRIGFLQEATRWWARWLKGVENGVENEPRFVTWIQDCAPPQAAYAKRDGHWLGHDSWPPPGNETHTRYLADGELAKTGSAQHRIAVKTPLRCGATAGEWMPLGAGPEMALDQRFEDAGAVVFDTEPLDADMTIIGAPIATLCLESNLSSGLVSLRLSDVFPDGATTRITYGVLNLMHRNGHEQPERLVPEQQYSVRVQLNDIAQRIPAGHRLRLSIATTQWPMFWPAAENATITVHADGSKLEIPVNRATDLPEVELTPAAIPSPPDITWLRPTHHSRSLTRDLNTGLTTLTYSRDEGAFVVNEHGLQIDSRGEEQHRVLDGEPCSASGKISWRLALKRGEWSTAVECEVVQTATPTSFILSMQLNAYEGEQRVFTRSESREIPRDGL